MLRSHYYCGCAYIYTDGVAADLPRIVIETGIAGGVALGPGPVPQDAMTHTDTHTTSEAGVAHEATPPNIPQERTETKTERRANDQRNPPLQNLTKRRQRHHLNRAKRRRRRMAPVRVERRS